VIRYDSRNAIVELLEPLKTQFAAAASSGSVGVLGDVVGIGVVSTTDPPRAINPPFGSSGPLTY
jgi:hypothetical protein